MTISQSASETNYLFPNDDHPAPLIQLLVEVDGGDTSGHTDLVRVVVPRHPGGELAVSCSLLLGPDRILVNSPEEAAKHTELHQAGLVEAHLAGRHPLAQILHRRPVGEGGDEGVDISEGGEVALLPGDVGQEVLLELPVSPEDGDERGDGVDVAVLEDGGDPNNLNQTMLLLESIPVSLLAYLVIDQVLNTSSY